MSTSSNNVDGVREVSESESVRLEAVGQIKNYAQDNLVVHVGKPVGSISGWIGTNFWQVWSDRSDAPGMVHARIDERTAETWTLDPALEKSELLSQAKDRLTAQIHAERSVQLIQAKADLAALRGTEV